MNVDSNWCSVKVSEDNMYALMCLHNREEENENQISAEKIMEFLTEQGILYGVNENAVHTLAENAMYEQYICVAKGVPATKGKDGFYEFLKSTEDIKKKPVINQDGTADYKNSLNLAIINEGELLARYIPATQGTEGIDVFNNTVPSLGAGKDLVPLRGRGIVASEDNREFFAQYCGHIVMDGSQICIDKLFIVKGDLNIDVGNIRFDGDVEIMGDVRSGMEIVSGGDVFIHGHVGAARIRAGKNITIQKGIQGRGACEIYASGDVICKFVENCRIYAVHDVYADSILNAFVTAENNVYVTSKNGVIVSSEVYGMVGVTVKEAGNDVGAPTLLRSGLPREFYNEAAELSGKIQEINGKIDAFNKHLKNLQNAGPSEKVAITKTKIMRAKIVLISKRNESMVRLNDLHDRISRDLTLSSIKVTGTAFSGVRIYIGTLPYLVNEPVKEVVYKVKGGEVLCFSLVD